MKKLFVLGLLVIGVLTLSGCKEDAPVKDDDDDTPVEITLNISIDDIELFKGDTETISYTTDPANTSGNMTYDIVSSTGDTIVSISNGVITGINTGEVTVEATFTNKSNSNELFTATTTFIITVSPTVPGDGNYILNSSFEDVLEHWNIDSTYGSTAYGTEIVDNFAHSGELALNLWYDNDADSVGDELDITLHQKLEGLVDGNYLFSLWYQGVATSIKMTVKDGDTVLATETFSGYDYLAVPDNHEYVNYGILIPIDGITVVDVYIEIEGQAEVWGYLDDVTFKEGTLDDLEEAPPSGEEGYINFIMDGNFTSIDAWTVDITGHASNKTATQSSGNITLWSDGPALFEIHQLVTLSEDTYNLAIYLNGGEPGVEFNSDEAYVYVKDDTATYTINLTPEGWGSGVMKRVVLEGIELQGEVEVGIYVSFTSGSNNWINLDNFTLWSYNIEVNESDISAANEADTLINNLPDLESLTLDDEDSVIAARSNYDSLTETQKMYVTGLQKLEQAEGKIVLLKQSSVFEEFNLDGTFETDDWLLETIGWTVTGGNLWTDGNWPYEGSMSYDMFKEQSVLEASMTHEVTFPAGTYEFKMYLSGESITSITVTIGDTTETLTVTSSEAYVPDSFTFTVPEGTLDVTITVVRDSTSGWVQIDSISLDDTE